MVQLKIPNNAAYETKISDYFSNLNDKIFSINDLAKY